MRFFLFIILTVIVVSCEKNSVTYIPSQKQLLVNEIRSKVSLQLKNEKNLYPCGTGGQMMNEIKMLYLAFNYYNEIDVDKARELIVAAGNLFLKEINDDERIRQYLVRYPFKPENIEMRIFLYNQDGSEPELEKLQLISLIEGKLRYKIGTLDSKNYFTTICEETFEEAVAKLEHASNLQKI